MKIAKLFLALIIGVGCAISAQQKPGPRDGLDLPATDLTRVDVGTSAPDFTLMSKDRNPITLSSFAGNNNVILVFYRGYW